jgi:DNA-binding CsgD family transcriptional regulator
MSPNYDTLVSSIYDCAANPELWPDVCCQVRDALDAAFVVVGFIDMTAYHAGRVKWHRRNSPWDECWLDTLDELIPSIPNGRMMYGLETDIAWTQLGSIPEQEFKQTDFYKRWVEPQKLRDTLNVKYLSRDRQHGVLGAPTMANRAPVSDAEKKLAESLSPHIRRAVMINDLTDNGRQAQALFRQVLDTLSVAVFIVGQGQKLVFTNAAGDQLLSEGQYLRLVSGNLQSRREPRRSATLEHAIEHAVKGDSAVGVAGIGIPLLNADGDRAAAYVLPLSGGDVRGEFGDGLCAVFVARRGEQPPMALDILRSLFDLTVSEARVALLVAKGDGPAGIAEALGVSVHTVRTHLKHCFAKTGSPDQTALSGAINVLMPPLK